MPLIVSPKPAPQIADESAARDPAKPAHAEALNRLSGGTYTRGTYETGDGKVLKLYNPTADVGRLDPAGFLRKTLADPVRFGLDFAGATAEGKKHFYEYGHNTHDPKDAGKLLINAALGCVPGSRELLQQGGLGLFKPRDWLRSLLQSSTGIGPNARPGQCARACHT